jgi:hypothetical protein
MFFHIESTAEGNQYQVRPIEVLLAVGFDYPLDCF